MKTVRVNVALFAVMVAALLAGCGTKSTPTGVTPTDTSPPAPPTALAQIASPTTGAAMLTWQASPASDVSGYDIFMYAPSPSQDNCYQQVASVAATVTNWTLPSVAYAQTRWYRVRSSNGGGQHSGLTAPFLVNLAPLGGTGTESGGGGGVGHSE